MKKRLLCLSSLLCLTNTVQAQVSSLSKAVITSDSQVASVPLPEQDKQAQQKLDALFAQQKKRPNIVWIVADDLGYGDLGVYGGGEMVGAATPHLDQLARGGLMLTSAYSQPTCTPTRSAILTGRLPIRTGLFRPILAGDKLTKNPWADEISLPTLLGQAGYNTLLVGKWHVGEGEGTRPQDVGFDEFYGYYRAQKEYTQMVDARKYPDLVLDAEKLAAYKALGSSQALVHGFKNGETKDVEVIDAIDKMAEGDTKLTQFSIDKIATLAKSDKPFFLELAFMKPHADNFPSKAFLGKSNSKYAYKDSVVEIDDHVGRVVKALADADVLDNTFIFFTSDNGPQLDGWPDTGYTPFRGGKGTGWEGALRIPAIAYWKGVITADQHSNELFDLMDLFNTSLRLAGALDKLPTDRYIDGIDQSAFLLGDARQSARDKVFVWSAQDFLAIRMREYKQHFKVINYHEPHLAIDMATIENVGLSPWTFNLFIDPKEAYPVGHRQNAWTASLSAEAKAHAATFVKYPPKDVGLGTKKTAK